MREPEALEALFELVWAGRVTNDALEGLREPDRSRSGRRRRGVRVPLYGRWSLLPPVEASPQAWARRLLAAFGVVARETASAAEAPVPWPLLLDALTTLEARGEVRRGYFVRGLSGIQFALPPVVERLRRRGSAAVRIVAAADPANAYGALLEIPADRPYRQSRLPGSWLIVGGGAPLLAVEGRGRRMVPLRTDRIEEALPALEDLARLVRGGRMAVERWGDEPVVGSDGEPLLAARGFTLGPRQMTYRTPIR
jgi:ATP-dependent Lhr-like helicase